MGEEAPTPERGPDRHPSSGALQPLLEVEDLHIDFFSRRGHVRAVRGLSLTVERGQTVALVGESGSGKSVASRAMMGIVDPPGEVVHGDIRWKSRSVLHGKAARAYAREMRGNELAMIFQDPVSSLNPLLTVGTQIGEVLRHHRDASRKQARRRAIDLLDLVGVKDPHHRVDQRSYEFSGGMCQRVLIAMALACEPELLIADEPTTALDVTIQAQILELLRDVQSQFGLAILLITHDLGVVAEFCERVAVMYAGRIIESGPVGEVFRDPGHPYTAGLLRAMPRIDLVLQRLATIEGSPPDQRIVSPGCAFRPRCVAATDLCRASLPPLIEVRAGRHVACVHAFDGDAPAADTTESNSGVSQRASIRG